MSLQDLKHEVLKPVYCMCNECKNLDEFICKKYNTEPPNKILRGNPFKEKENREICRYFEKK